MKKRTTLVAVIILLIAGAVGGATAGKLAPGMGGRSASAATLDVQPVEPLAPAGTAFTYQGKLNSAGNPATGQYDFQFALYNAATNGQLLDTEVLPNVTVTNGLFTVALNFNAGLFNGEARWLQIAVRPANNGNFVTLTPRQELKPAPQAIFAQNAPWTGVTGKPDAFNPQTPRHSAPVVDNTGIAGQNSAITLGSDGLGLITYYDSSSTALKVAHCDNVDCSASTITVLDNTGFVGDWSSVTVGPDGLGIIAYYDASLTALKVAHCNDIKCTQATITTVDNSANVGQYPSIIVTTNSETGHRYLYPTISYYDVTNTALKVASCNNVACTSADTWTVDNSASVGTNTSITTGFGGSPLISYYDATNSALKVASCTSPSCYNGAASLYTIDNAAAVGQYSSITTGADGYALISYWNASDGELRVAHCTTITCSSSNVYVVGGGGAAVPVGQYSSITIGRDGLGIISFYDNTNEVLKVARCVNVQCSSLFNPSLPQVGLNSSHGQFTSITIGSDGYPLISYYEQQTTNLRVIHCANEFCTPNQIRR